ncbi:glucose 1-dehydrogenase [Salirhabdus sp. Marseille-P4669]|uniref:glucose 1-dehydrogenase n=1 Tax=Salirhabdus sp. Marseille-P4669 TaxID=2042310 RepID=UPI000C7A2292|nr:glucose 1-dehydrogenase [Salirhabdus sp. Marseille-P4669]
MSFEEKVVIVTGGSNGIGRQVALEYVRENAKVVIADIDEVNGRELVANLNEGGGEAIFCLTDVRKPEDIAKMVAKTLAEFGKLDILINNAGISVWRSPYEMTVDEWDRIIQTNLRGQFLCAREAAKAMRKTGGGKIVNMASTRAFMSEKHSEAYAATKGGSIALTHALAASFAEDHIQVNSISPGWIETEGYEHLTKRDHAQHFSNRVGKPMDIAKACLYLTQEDNEFINGANLTIDGGMTKKMIYKE